MNTVSSDVMEAVTRITNTDEPFVWVRVSRRCNTKRLINNFHRAIYRAMLRAGLYYNISQTTRKNTPYLLIDKRWTI